MRENNIQLKTLIFERLTKSNRNHDSKNTLPEEIFGYKLLKPFVPKDASSLFSYGIYKGLNNETCFAKIWQGENKNSAYYWLLNEINVYKAFGLLYKKDGNLIKEKFSNIYLPKFINTEIKENELILLLENVDGKHLDSFGDNNFKVGILKEIFDYLSFIDSRFTFNRINNFMKIDKFKIAFAYPYLLLNAFVKYPSEILLFAKSGFLYLANLGQLLSHKDSNFTHRDLYGNILVKADKIYILDFQLSAKTFSLFDIISTEFALWDKKELFQNYMDSGFIKETIYKKDNFRLYKLLSLYTALFELVIIKNLSEKETINFLKWHINLKK